MDEEWCDGSVFYHGSHDKASVLENGVDPDHRDAHMATGGHDHANLVYVSPKKTIAQRFGDPVAVCIHNTDQLESDSEFTTDESVTYPGEIPPEDVRDTPQQKVVVDFSEAHYTGDHITVPVGDEEFRIEARRDRVPEVKSVLDSPLRFKGTVEFDREEPSDIEEMKKDPDVVLPGLLKDLHEKSGTEEYCETVDQAYREYHAKDLNLECKGSIPREELEKLRS